MATLPETKAELEQLRSRLFDQFQEAQAKGDTAEMARLEAVAGEIDDALDDLAIGGLSALAGRLTVLRAKVDALTAQALKWPFGSSPAPESHERPNREVLPDNDFEDAGPDKPAPEPKPVASDVVPKVKPGWSKTYLELWDSAVVSSNWEKSADAIAKKIIASQTRYKKAVAGTSVPWWFVAVTHSMECSLRFDQHLHNGDRLTARTKRVPKGRPAAGGPPFTWEESANDAIQYERLDRVTDWSLSSALYHWHRYNGINNAYKRNGIPTPYLWSGSQHYRKGKYVKDGKFDPEAVSKQVGAAVLLKSLVKLGAVTIDSSKVLNSNPDAATGHLPSISLEFSGEHFKHLDAELKYPGELKIGPTQSSKKKRAIRQVQEWLNIHECVTSIDGDFGESTGTQVRKFQRVSGLPETGRVDRETWALLTAPMRRAFAKIEHAEGTTLGDAVVQVARQHIAEKPVEIGGNNRGPWVRMYMKGRDGSDQLWCAGFVCFMVAQAARDLDVAVPIKRQVSVDKLVKDAKSDSRFISESSIGDGVTRMSKLPPGTVFVVRRTSTDWTHTGIVMKAGATTFDTLEGNTGGDNGRDGANARQGNRAYPKKDFLTLV